MTTVLDTRSFDARSQGALVLSLFEGLKEGQAFEVLTAGDSDALCRQLDALGIPQLKWQFLERAPRQWKLKIEKLDAKALAEKQKGGCCGMCGG